MSTARKVASSPFTEFESFIIEAWLDLETSVDEDLDLALRGIGVCEEPRMESLSRLDIAVAHIVLHSVQHRLPDSGSLRPDGRPVTGRAISRAETGSLSLLPWHVLTVGWACEHMDRPAPEAYYLAWLPYYDRYVVTVSRASPKTWGYHDAALGDFGRAANPISSVQCTILDWWQLQASRYRRTRWQRVLEQGLASSHMAEGWGRSVWVR